MKTIRRIYFYLVTAISVELLAWGVINLLRSIFRTGLAGGQSESLSIGLAQILVSIPIFIVHWLVVQKDAAKSEEEQTTVVRAMFLYGILLGTLVPVVQNILAFVNRLLLDTTGVSRLTALVGSSQSASDNLIAIGINLLLAAYFYSILRKDWQFSSDPANLIDLRRIYWYFWMLYGLGMTVLGVQQLIQFMLRKAVMISPDILAGLLNPVTLLVLGVPIWVYTWMTIQRSITRAEERNSTWRVGVMYFLVLAGAISTGVAAITILGWILRWAFGEAIRLQGSALEAQACPLVPDPSGCDLGVLHQASTDGYRKPGGCVRPAGDDPGLSLYSGVPGVGRNHQRPDRLAALCGELFPASPDRAAIEYPADRSKPGVAGGRVGLLAGFLFSRESVRPTGG